MLPAVNLTACGVVKQCQFEVKFGLLYLFTVDYFLNYLKRRCLPCLLGGTTPNVRVCVYFVRFYKILFWIYTFLLL